MIGALLSPVADLVTHDDSRNALIAGCAVASAAGLVGHLLVLRNQVFTGDALSHVAFTGSLAGYATGTSPLLGLYAGTVATALGIGSLGGRARGRDVVLGTVFAWVLGIGVLLLSIYTTARSATGGAAGVSVLFGSIYGISVLQTVLTTTVAALASVALIALGRPLLLASIAPELAAARGLPVRLLGLAFLALVGVTVGAAVQAVGALLIVGLLVTPAAAAQRLTADPFRAMALSALIGVGAVVVGLLLAQGIPRLPPSSAIVGVAFGVYMATTLSRGRRRGARRNRGAQSR